ncbi:MAG TPA: pyridoxamine 5'-phosphate oxidase family protein, partial [Sporichthya sp.]|nr:pyridoxamine 5'-phosphate oxidase family protein [Sporichthya sp.]
TTGFHAGEFEVQNRAGVRAVADSRAGMLNPADLHDGAVRFLAERTFAPLSGRDAEGRLWVTALEGPAGFLAAGPDWLRVRAAPRKRDPLHGLPVGQPVGLIAIEFASRRRFRLNGALAAAGDDFLEIALDQAFGNCPKYIHPRELRLVAATEPAQDTESTSGLSPDQAGLIGAADTFFLGTTHPDRGNDVSHKAGPAGFVQVRDGALWWPDLVGNDLFNSFGNLAVDDTAALFFADFATGRTLHLSGRATVEWEAPTDTGRGVRFAVEAVRWGVPLLQREA